MAGIICRKCGKELRTRVAKPVKCNNCGTPTGLRLPAPFLEGLAEQSINNFDADDRDALRQIMFPSLTRASWKMTDEERIADRELYFKALGCNEESCFYGTKAGIEAQKEIC